jgi:hypothetical protein
MLGNIVSAYFQKTDEFLNNIEKSTPLVSNMNLLSICGFVA